MVLNEAFTPAAWLLQVPWSPRVEQKLQQRLGGDWNIEVVNGGEQQLDCTMKNCKQQGPPLMLCQLVFSTSAAAGPAVLFASARQPRYTEVTPIATCTSICRSTGLQTWLVTNQQHGPATFAPS